MTRHLKVPGDTDPLADYACKGFIPRAMLHVMPELAANTTEWTWARYVDIGCQGEGWREGRTFWKWIVEVENNWKELHGTLLDLSRIQACRKLGVFYRPEPGDVLGPVRDAVVQVFEAFGKNGFAEATGTRYEVVVLPEVLSADDPSTFRCLHVDFTAGEALAGLKEGHIVPLL